MAADLAGSDLDAMHAVSVRALHVLGDAAYAVGRPASR
jgi:hypothetical protein